MTMAMAMGLPCPCQPVACRCRLCRRQRHAININNATTEHATEDYPEAREEGAPVTCLLDVTVTAETA